MGFASLYPSYGLPSIALGPGIQAGTTAVVDYVPGVASCLPVRQP
jgi:hypothetical protein